FQTLLGLKNMKGSKNLLGKVSERVKRNGIVETKRDGAPVFAYRTFAEFLVAEFLWEHLNKSENKGVWKVFLDQVLLKSQNKMIMKFLNRYMEKSKVSENQTTKYQVSEDLEKRVTEM